MSTSTFITCTSWGECLEGGGLFDRIAKHGRFHEGLAADAVWQMLLAQIYIHVHEVVHGDVKVENSLFLISNAATI